MKTIKITLFAFAITASAISCSSEPAPDETVKQFFDAIARKNFDAAAKLTTAESTQSLADVKKATEIQNKTVEEQVANAKKLKYSAAEVKGDSAFIDVSSEKMPKPMVYTLVKKDGKWLLDLSPSSMQRMTRKQ